MNKTPGELYKERLGRIEDAIKLKIPDRIPVLASFRYFSAKYAGMTYEETFYKPKEWIEANKTTILEYQPDMYYPPITESGRAYEMLGLKQAKWPGHGLPSDVSYQFVEDEYMKAGEYDAFLADPSNYAFRTYLPRLFEALEPLKNIPSFDSLIFGYHSLSMLAAELARPEVEKALGILINAGREYVKTRNIVSGFDKQMAELGFPSIGKSTLTAFDVVSDFQRGMRGSMLDMFRQPDKLLQAIEKIEPIIIRNILMKTESNDNPRIYIPLHRGADGFMSDEQFRTFYWPSLKRLILTLIEEGLTPCPFFEGNYDSRLEYLRELPKGKILARFDTTDMLKAKEIVGDIMCICGNVPVSLMQFGTPEDVKSYCKKLIDIAGKGGGFIMCTRSVLDEVKPENVKTWIDFTKEYGIY